MPSAPRLPRLPTAMYVIGCLIGLASFSLSSPTAAQTLDAHPHSSSSSCVTCTIHGNNNDMTNGSEAADNEAKSKSSEGSGNEADSKSSEESDNETESKSSEGSDHGNKGEVSSEAETNTADLCNVLERLLASGQGSPDAQAHFRELCPNHQPITDNSHAFCTKMRDLLESGDQSNQQDKELYYKTCFANNNHQPEGSDCQALRTKIVNLKNAGQTGGTDFTNLTDQFQSQCQDTKKAPPPAGFEDVVLPVGQCSQFNNSFPDTEACSQGGLAAQELYRRGVIGGFPDGEFKGDRPVNRAELSKFLLLACHGQSAIEDTFTGRFRDVDQDGWYRTFVESAAKLGFISGYPDGTFKPAQTVNHAEFSKMITLACGINQDLPSSYTDVTSADWFSHFAGATEKYSMFPDTASTHLFDAEHLMTRQEVAIAIYGYLSNR